MVNAEMSTRIGKSTTTTAIPVTASSASTSASPLSSSITTRADNFTQRSPDQTTSSLNDPCTSHSLLNGSTTTTTTTTSLPPALYAVGEGGGTIVPNNLDGNNNPLGQTATEHCEFSLCFGCRTPIHDQYLYKVLDQSYHEKCLYCSQCGDTFRTRTCFTRNGLLFCREHFLQAYGPKCARCAAPIGERAIVRRANQHIYHLECFQCVVCKRELNTGDQFYLIPMDGRLVCRHDYESAAKEGSDMDCGNKRPRTTISAKSLETLKLAYQDSKKPARHVREQLAAQTGLDMRVVQVWFQNRRAKDKRLKKDNERRLAAAHHHHHQQQQQNGIGTADHQHRSASGSTVSSAGGGGGPGSVMSVNGMPSGGGGAIGGGCVLFGRGTGAAGCGSAGGAGSALLDSDSAASNEAESPFYAYTNPEASSDVDVHSMSEFYDPLSGMQQQTQQQQPGTPSSSSLQQLSSSMLTPFVQQQQQLTGEQQQQQHQQANQSSPRQQQQLNRSPGDQHHQLHHQSSSSLFLLEQLNGPKTPLGGEDINAPFSSSNGHADPGTAQRMFMVSTNNGSAVDEPSIAAGCHHPAQMMAGLVAADQQQQYLLAAATAGVNGFGPPPPHPPPSHLGHLMGMPSAAPDFYGFSSTAPQPHQAPQSMMPLFDSGVDPIGGGDHPNMQLQQQHMLQQFQLHQQHNHQQTTILQ